MSHRLLLPLPSDYSNGVEYATFLFGSHEDAVSHSLLQAYLDRLEAFLNKTRLIQYHPENYFSFLAGEGEALKHLDGSAVMDEEINYMRELCESFQTMLHSDIINDLSSLIREGPPAMAPKCLHSFFTETRALRLNRKRRPLNDAAQVTLRTAHDGPFPRLTEMEERRRERVLAAVTSYGMGPKKQHEVAVMRATVADLVRHCNTPAAAETGICDNPVETVINIGEGKGYVSRALALCDGLQVVGLDCNPAHKERAVERVEFLMEGRFSVEGEGQNGRDILNLFYETRGHMATIACRVGPKMDWIRVLSGHVRLCSSASGAGDFADLPALQDEHFSEKNDIHDELTVSQKIQCRICEHIERRGSTASIVRHTMRHLRQGEGVECKDIPSIETVNMWNGELSVEGFSERIIKFFYTHDVQYGCSSTKRESLSDDKAEKKCDLTTKGWNLLLSPRLPRGTRAEVIVPLRQSSEEAERHQEKKRRLSEPSSDTFDAPEKFFYEYVPATLTIVGYDCAPNRHLVILDHARRKESFTLLKDEDATVQSSVAWPSAADAWASRVAVISRVLPPLPTRAPAVHVPDLRNTALVGLHPCGDLGSSICRIFTESASGGLLLVSCCWHALTNDGFPLSMELRRRGWCTEKLSLLLATQPLDMWATASSEGHRSSARMLFFRAVLKILWVRLAERWTQSAAAASCCCAFAEVPHLEPPFLRRMAKEKNTMVFEKLYVEVCQEYFSANNEKQSAFSWRQRVCATCRVLQETFLTSEENIAVAAQLGRDYYKAHFSSFMGLTVLRMWMCHLVESWLLLDRALYLSESLRQDKRCSGSVVSLVPLFDGAVSPRMYGILARRII